MILALSVALAVLGNTGTFVVFFKPGRLRYAELPAWFWAALGGPESRARLRFIMASRERAARDAVRVRVERDIEAGRLAAEAMEPGAFGTFLAMRRSRKAEAFAGIGAAQAAGLTAGVTVPAWYWDWHCSGCGDGDRGRAVTEEEAREAATTGVGAHSRPGCAWENRWQRGEPFLPLDTVSYLTMNPRGAGVRHLT